MAQIPKTSPDGHSTPGRLGAISLNIKEKSVLYAAYMPYVRGGGIFIPTARPYKLGDEIFMLISLLDDPAKLPVAGRVIWISPAG
ncbi:MAG TPA: PilZ domain-containing protein, partial [Burkholderiales bacterium]